MQFVDTYNKCLVMEKNLNAKQLYVDTFFGGLVAIKPVPGPYSTPLCLRKDSVFRFDEELYNELCKLFDKGDHANLQLVWRKAVPWRPPETTER